MSAKLLKLRWSYICRRIFKNIGFNVSIVFLLFSVSISCLILVPNCFRRVPVYAYLVREMRLPLVYKLSGKVIVTNACGDFLNTSAEIYVGGYSAKTNSAGEFQLSFSAPKTSSFFVVVRYAYGDGEVRTRTEQIVIDDGDYEVIREFSYATENL